MWGWLHWPLELAHVHISPFAVLEGGMCGRLPVVEIMVDANSIYSERVSSVWRLIPLASWWLMCRVYYGRVVP